MSLGIQFQIPKMLQEKTNGVGLLEVEGDCVHECIVDLVRRHPHLKGMILDRENRILLKWLVYINDKSVVSSGELSNRVKDGDKIALLPMVAGG
jgi:molybdopterin converting factor small subunit